MVLEAPNRRSRVPVGDAHVGSDLAESHDCDHDNELRGPGKGGPWAVGRGPWTVGPWGVGRGPWAGGHGASGMGRELGRAL